MKQMVLDNIDILLISLVILFMAIIYTVTAQVSHKTTVYVCSDLGKNPPPDVIEICRKAKR